MENINNFINLWLYKPNSYWKKDISNYCLSGGNYAVRKDQEISNILKKKDLFEKPTHVVIKDGKVVDVLPANIPSICNTCVTIPYPPQADPNSVPPLPIPGINTLSFPNVPGIGQPGGSGISRPAVPGNGGSQPLGKRK